MGFLVVGVLFGVPFGVQFCVRLGLLYEALPDVIVIPIHILGARPTLLQMAQHIWYLLLVGAIYIALQICEPRPEVPHLQFDLPQADTSSSRSPLDSTYEN